MEYVLSAPNSPENSADALSIMSALWELSQDSAVVCSMDGAIIWANPATEHLLGYSHDELRQMKTSHFGAVEGDGALFSGASFVESFVNDMARLTVGETDEIERVVSGRDGVPFPVLIRMQRVEFRGNPAVLCIVRNISRIRKQEAELSQTSKMQAIGQLAGGIAHDFNNALGGIIGYAELAIEDAGENMLQRENLEKLLMAAERAKKLVKQILTFSRQNTPRKDVVALPQLVTESVAFLRSSVPSSVMIEDDVSTQVLAVAGDATKIQEMLFNLATNAVSAMDDNGTLKIGLEQVVMSEPFVGVVGESPAGNYAKITVADDGCGIDPSFINMIFEPFFSTKHPDEGNGMGLSVVFGIVRSHGGNIQLESAPGVGTCVRVYLPVIPLRTISSPAPFVTSVKGDETLLVVDDEPLLVDICGKLLQSMGYRVITTMDVNEALDVLQDESVHIDLLLTDQTMPQMKGSELAARAMKLRPGLPVILCTGFSRTIDEEAAMKMGISRFIQKPVRKKELAAAVREAIQGGLDPKAL
ncbi:MAG: response regulator [Deltaproteobacteria bacterium]|nr:response regulator [Deltaproteobacteria bacterium]